MSDDEYDQFNFSEFTEDEIAQVEAQISAIRASDARAAPKVTIEIEGDQAQGAEVVSSGAAAAEPPLQRFRYGNILAVTDLSSPAWCEVQFEYGLLGRRYRPVTSRPKAFTSISGKTINIDTTTAIRNDETTKKGKAIHKKLEEEVRPPEELIIEPTTEEERWALRFINLCMSIQSVFEEGFTREVPVFGTIQGAVVVGFIDEVVATLVSNNDDPRRDDYGRSKRARADATTTEPPLDQSHVDSTSKDTAGQGTHKPSYKLSLSDTKTRKTKTLPPHHDTISARVQLMLYYRLLSDLLQVSPPFDFSAFWKTLDLDEHKVFSRQFLLDTGLVTSDNVGNCITLADVTQLWFSITQQSRCVEVDPTLQILYRLQPTTDHLLKNDHKRPRHSGSLHHREDEELARAIAASLEGIEGQTPHIPEFANDEDELRWTLQESLRTDAPREAPAVEAPSHRETIDKFEVIGTKHFQYNGIALQTHVADMLLWWHGKRKPRGVSVENVSRCRSCEYYNDCEWREQKAAEHLEKLKQHE